ncbi:DUF5330 domain-containing protein [Roseibium sp. MMSF_3544]|uniref:DUF5330 domain-containing protein n=1 Tax=unclassified Roseibium TaxID=2629323 RepID=UPI00273DB812|nr:DUF5330 domain-containing protein [Roseibium sp. MMSF_3544]
MLFLLRTAFWLTLVLVLIPLGSEQERPAEQTAAVDPVSAFIAAQATVSDIGGFCSRNPQACETGGNALTVIGSRAKDGARIVFDFLDTQITDDPAGDVLVTGSTATERPLAVQTGTQAFLPPVPVQKTLSKVETAQGPVPRPKPRSGRNS